MLSRVKEKHRKMSKLSIVYMSKSRLRRELNILDDQDKNKIGQTYEILHTTWISCLDINWTENIRRNLLEVISIH